MGEPGGRVGRDEEELEPDPVDGIAERRFLKRI